jgi:hypothetical protein
MSGFGIPNNSSICLNNSRIASNKNCKKKGKIIKKENINSCVQHFIPKIKEHTKSKKKRHNS